MVIHYETQGQQNTTLEDSGRNGGVAYGPEQDGITGSQFLDNSIREQLSGGVVSGCSQVICVVETLIPAFGATASRTFIASATTSVPMPSPGIRARFRSRAMVESLLTRCIRRSTVRDVPGHAGNLLSYVRSCSFAAAARPSYAPRRGGCAWPAPGPMSNEEHVASANDTKANAQKPSAMPYARYQPSPPSIFPIAPG